MDPAALEWRYERKFLVTERSFHDVLCSVRMHPARFARAHATRHVSNLYLDTYDRRCFHDAVDGLATRRKYRIRWYGELTGPIPDPVFEVKVRQGTVGRKHAFSLAPFSLARTGRLGRARERIRQADLPPVLRERAASLQLALLNRYRREYWISADGALRLTVDTGLEFVAISAEAGSLARRCSDREVTVLELKYALPHDGLGRWAASRFPFRLSKSSKYVLGVERLAP